MNRRIFLCIAALAVILAAGVCASLYLRDDGGSAEISPRKASELAAGDEEKDLPSSVDELLDNLKLDGFSGLLATLDGDQLALFGFSDIAERLSRRASIPTASETSYRTFLRFSARTSPSFCRCAFRS